jgi:hypothetical protein
MKRFEKAGETCSAILRAGADRAGILTGEEREEVSRLRARLTEMDDSVEVAVRGLGAARAHRQELLTALRGRLLAAKAHVACLAAMHGIPLPVARLGKAAWTVGRVIPLAETYRRVLAASGEDPLTRTLNAGLTAAMDAFVQADATVASRHRALSSVSMATRAELTRAAGRLADLRTMMALRTPREERRTPAAPRAA